MRISAKAEYACVAMVELAAHHGSPQPLPVKAIAESHGIPQRYLVQILLQLKGAGYVASIRGALGGYQLTMPPEEISLADIMMAIDGPFPARHEPAAAPRSPATLAVCSVWNEVLNAQRSMLHEVSLADLARRMRQPTDMYYI